MKRIKRSAMNSEKNLDTTSDKAIGPRIYKGCLQLVKKMFRKHVVIPQNKHDIIHKNK